MESYRYRGEFVRSGEIFSCNDLKQLYRACMLNLTCHYLEEMRKNETVRIFRENDIVPIVQLNRSSDKHSCKIRAFKDFKAYDLRSFTFDEEEGI